MTDSTYAYGTVLGYPQDIFYDLVLEFDCVWAISVSAKRTNDTVFD